MSAPHLAWVYDGDLTEALDAATWLDTTHELRKLGWEVTLLAVGPSGRQAIRGVEVQCLPTVDRYFLRQAVFHDRAVHYLRGLVPAPDVVMFHQISAPWMAGLRLGVRRTGSGLRRPLLALDVRSLHMPEKRGQGLKAWLRGSFMGLINRAGRLWVDGYLTITPRMAKAVAVPAEKYWGDWPSGADPQLFSAACSERQWPSAGQPVRLIYIGALHVERNLLALGRAVLRANEAGMAFQLALIGEGTQQAALQEIARESGGCIQVSAPVPHAQVPAILAQAHVGVLPFPGEEKFLVSSPIKLFEYMAAGMPILATRIACHADVIGAGDYAFWAESADEDGLLAALRTTWQNRERLPALGASAALASADWTWEASAAKLDRALRKGMAKFQVEGGSI